ncbi:MAG TPA: pitrilysin family protein [Vicinamibacterales bacterium]|nr:pitrilysin family protein [Vicinamibacterales bacterium]
MILALTIASPLSAQVTDWPAERPPRPLPARSSSFPLYQIRTLPNGLQVVAVSHHEQPAVSLRLLVRAGGAQDPSNKPGVAYLAASLLDQGTTSKNAEQVASTIDSIGGAIGAGAGSDITFINAAVMKDSLGLALDLVSDLARHPAFANEEIDRQRQQIVSGLKVSYDDPDYLAGVVFDRLVYGFHPYGKPDSGTPDSIAAISRDDLLAFHKRWFGANNAILAVVGDVTPEEAFDGAQRAFGSWERVDLPTIKGEEAPPSTRRVVIIDRPGAAQTEIRVGNISLPRRHPDYLALDIATKILGGEGGNRLHRVLRSERGLTYGASADLNALKDTGDIVAETDTRSEKTAEALRIIVEEIVRLQRQRVQQRELSDAQEYLTGSFPLTVETPSAIALQVLNAVFYGLDLNELQTYRERVNAISVEDIQRVAQQYLRPDKLSIVLVGDASIFAKDLPGVGFDQVERIPISELDLAAPDLKRHAPPRPGRLEPVSYHQTAPAGTPGSANTNDDRVRALIARAVAAKGGLNLLRSIQTVRAESVATVQSNGINTDLPSTTTIRYPGAFRTDAMTPAGRLVQVFSAGKYWVQDPNGVHDAPESMAAVIRGNVQRDTVPLLLALHDGKILASLSEVAENERKMPALEVALPGSTSLTLIFDPVTTLLAKSKYRMPGPAGEVHVEEIYSNYRDVKGLKVPFTTEVRRDGAPAVQRTLRTFEFNVPVDPALFNKPS